MTKKDQEALAGTLKMWHESQMEKVQTTEESFKELIIMISLTFENNEFDDYKFVKECGVERKEEDLI